MKVFFENDNTLVSVDLTSEISTIGDLINEIVERKFIASAFRFVRKGKFNLKSFFIVKFLFYK